MSACEQRAGLGIDIIGDQGSSVGVTLYTERGSEYAPLHMIPDPDGNVHRTGLATSHQGFSGAEIKWYLDILPKAEAAKIISGYIQTNGWRGSPDSLKRLGLID